ncbi:hypothetical protein BGX27_007251 [Mortierella sp. AM989]|nr:hypothetical protein BGX27_007251 [Mortierella sp. AM989]
MSNPDHLQGTHSQDNDQPHVEPILNDQQGSFDEEDEEEEFSDQDYYDPEDDLEYFHDQKLRIEESWIEWERQQSVNNRQNVGFHQYNIFQKPGSMKRKERRKRSALAQLNSHANRPSSASSIASGSGSASGSGQGSGGDGSNSTAAEEKSRRLGSYRPALATSIVHSYSNITWEAAQAAREKRLAEKAAPIGSGQNIICTMPAELLSHIVSHLEPNELFNMSLVCRLFYHIVNADSCWKEAFMKFFGASIPFKRLDPKSWRGEYIKRTKLLRRWEKGRGSNVLINPFIGQITKLWAEADNTQSDGSFLVGGLAEGVVARYDPAQGKVQRVFRILQLVQAEIMVMAMDRRRVLWGLSTGQVCLTTLSYATAGQSFETFAGFHHGPVSCVKLVPHQLGFVLTGGVDGTVKLWDVAKSRCVYEFWTGSNLIGDVKGRIDHICCEPGSCVIAGTSRGEIYVWDVDINSIIALPSVPSSSDNDVPAGATADTDAGTPISNVPTPLPPVVPKVVSISEEFKGVGYLEVDFGLYNSGLILAHAVGSTVMQLYSLHTLTRVATLNSPAHFTPISAVHWDIPKHEKPMISLSNGSRLTSYGRHELPSLLVTGDVSGNICIWYLSDALKRHTLKMKNLHESQLLNEVIDLQPTCVMKGHDTSITSLFVDKLIIVSGSHNGWAKTWNPVNGKFISVLNTGHIRGREANNTNSSAINCIVVNSQKSCGALSIGGVIRCWDFSPEAVHAKDKHRKHIAKKPVHYSGGPKNKIQIDIRHSVEETVSLHRLEAQTKERRENLHRRYNNLEGLNMVDMTDEEVVEYVMMLSKDQDDQESAQTAFEVQQIKEMEEELSRERRVQFVLNNGGEGSSTAPSRFTSLQDDEGVTEQELEEEEELVRRAIALSMLDTEATSSSNFDSHFLEGSEHEDLHGYHSHDHPYQPHDWESSHVVDVNLLGGELQQQEDQQIVHSILQELEEGTDNESSSTHEKGKNRSEVWPTLGEASAEKATTTPSSTILRTPPPLPSLESTMDDSVDINNKREEVPVKKAMTWSMVARTNSEASISAGSGMQRQDQDAQQQAARQPAVIKQYPRSASQEEIEDEEIQLARILSLSMVEK